MRPLIDEVQKRVATYKDDLANGVIAQDDYPRFIGIIKGLREAIDLIKEWEAKSMSHGEEEEWQQVEGESDPPPKK